MTSGFTESAVDRRDPEEPVACRWAVLDATVIGRAGGRAGTGSWAPAVEDVRARQMPPALAPSALAPSGSAS
ncbi:hypothetical protein OG923_29980 [Streptomyces halstedii]|uniref:hypothetical protein n=1 Tax=Streptomyces halstedii TaxID=1944 RepID=UPI00324AF8DA